MIKIKKIDKRKKVKPHYILEYNYMIGDADGETTEKCKISLDNPYVERYCKLLSNLEPTEGTWGLSLDFETLESLLGEKQITDDDFQFLTVLMFEDSDSDFVIPKEHKKHSKEFYGGVQTDVGYSFLTLEDLELYYIDEQGIQHETEIID